MPLQDVLGRVPFLAGYEGTTELNRQRQAGDLAQAGGLMQILQQIEAQKAKRDAVARLEQYRTAMAGLPPDASEEDMLRTARPWQGADQIGQQITASRDRKAALEQRMFEQQQALQAKKELAEQALAAKMELAKQQGADRMTLMQMQMQGRKEIAAMIAANKQPPQPQAPVSIQDPNDPTKALLVPPGQAYGQRPFQKPSISQQNAEMKKQQTAKDLDRAIVELESASKDGGLIDKSTGSGAGALVDIAGNFVGYATKGAQAVGALQPIYDLALKMVPRFEGPQSDKDTKTYQEASGQLANPAVPNKTKKLAAKELVRLMKARRGQFVAKDAVGTEADTPAAPAADPLGIR